MTLSRLLRTEATILSPTNRGIKVSLVLTIMAAFGLAETARAGDGFTWFTNAPDISPGTTGSWQDINLVAHVPADATGVVVQLVNSGPSDYRAMVRGKEDTRDLMTGGSDGELRNKTHRFQVVKVDANRLIRGYISNSDVLIQLMAYTTGTDPVYFTTPPQLTPASGSWESVDVSSQVDADADGVILLVYNSAGSDYTYAIKETASSYSTTSLGLRDYQNTMFMVGLDANKKFDAWIQNTAVKIYLVAQTKGSVVYYADDTVVADPPNANSWDPMDADDYAVPAAANGVVLLTEVPSRTRAAVRHGDSNDDWGNTEYVDNSTLIQQACGLNAANEWDELFKDSGPSAYIAAYTTYSALTVNYRSIGTDTGTLYSTGNATVSAGSSIVTFAGGASLPTNVGQGDELVVGGETFYILTRDSATQATMQQPAAAPHTNTAYTIERVYNTLQAWETARQGDLVADDRREIGVCYDDGDFNAGVDIDGSTTNGTRYMKLTVAEGQRHSGVAGGGVVVDAGGGPGAPLLWVRDPYTQIEWLEVMNFDRWAILVSSGAPNNVFQNLLMHDGVGSYPFMEIGGTSIVRNCILYDGYTGIDNTGSSNNTIENVTVYDMSQYGMDMDATADITVRNTIAVGSGTTDFSLPGTINYFGNNMYSATASFDPDSQDGGNQPPPTDLEDLFISLTPGSEDLHLEPLGNKAVDKGLDLSSDFTDDIDGETRVWPWDIGADRQPITAFQFSIGTDTGTIYSTGNASVSAGSNTVTFAGGADLPVNIGAGDQLSVGVESLWILSRDSSTQVTTQLPAALNHASEAYTIGRAHNTIQAWEDARDGDLVSGKRIEVGVCYNDGPFVIATPIEFDGSTTDADHYMKLTVAEGHRHDGTAGTGVVIDCNGGFGNDAVIIQDPYTIVEWLEITDIQDVREAVRFTTDCTGSVCSNMLIHDIGHYAFLFSLSPGGATIRNCITYDLAAKPVLAANGSVAYIENCTFDNTGTNYGITAYNPSTIHVKNTISVGAGLYDINVAAGTVGSFGYNMYSTFTGFDPASYEGNNQAPPNELDDLFVSITPGSEDFHLEDGGHNAMDRGLNLSADFVADIDGQTRLAPWDIGADWNPLGINYRSIGTDTGTLYSLNDASVGLDSTTVTFDFGTDLPTYIGCGDELVIDTETFYILSRDSSTQVTVQLPAATAHTNGSYTIKRVYNTLQAWHDDVKGDLVAENRREIGVCYRDVGAVDDGWFTNKLVIGGSTTDAGHYMHLTVAEGQRHNGLKDTGAGIDSLRIVGWESGSDAITVQDAYTRLEYLELKDLPHEDAIYFAAGADNGLVDGVFVHGYWQNHPNAGLKTAALNTTVRNSIFTGGTSAGISMENGAGAGLIVENCTIVGNPGVGHGLYCPTGSGSVTVRNTISVNHDSGYDFYIETAGGVNLDYFGYNMYRTWGGGFDPKTCGNCAGGNQLPPSDLERLFVDTSDSVVDFHLELKAHRAGNTGLDLSASFTDDIDGVTRVDSWDIGADEAVSGTDPLSPAIITWKEVDPN